ncbi:component of the 3 5 exoribonuclease for 3 processing of 5.8S rRNA [Nucleospora cyclopteri]
MNQKIATYRIDGRTNEEFRNISIETGRNNFDGFITLFQGETVVRATQKIPNDKTKFKVVINFLETACSAEMNERKQYDLKFGLEQVFNQIVTDKLPVYIEITVLQNNGSLFSSLINVCTLCMCYCGIEMSDFAVSLTFNEGIDLCLAEENKTYDFCIVYLFNQGTVIYQECVGQVQRKTLLESQQKAIYFCKKLALIFQKNLINIY